MAYTTSHSTGGSIRPAISNFFAAIGRSIVIAAESNHRLRRVEQLQAMSDAQLAERGIKRENIVRVAFADLLGL